MASSMSFCGKPLRPIASMNSRRSGFEFGKRDEFFLAHRRKARQESEVEGRHPHRRRRHLVHEMHQRAHLGALHRIVRREVVRSRRDLVEIFDDDRRIDDDRAVMIERRHHAVRIEREVVGLELIAGEEVELDLGERQLLGVEHEAHTLTAGRLRRVVELECHEAFPDFSFGLGELAWAKPSWTRDTLPMVQALMRHQCRHRHRAQNRARHAAEHELAQT